MDYEKKYKNALEWARQVMHGETGFIRKEVEDVFPELKESEDERIRQEILTYLTNVANNAKQLTPYTHQMQSWLAWLEKQGENKKLDANKVIEWLENHLPNVTCYGHTLIKQFKKDFGL